MPLERPRGLMRPFLAVLVAILIVSMGWIPPATMAVSTLDACPADWELQPTEDRTSLSDVAVVGHEVWAVGSSVFGRGSRRPYIRRRVAGEWTTVGAPAPGSNDALDSGGGRAFTSIRIPQTTEGTGQDVVAIDHDQNGLTDFLVLNGESIAGPIQLISAQRSGGGT